MNTVTALTVIEEFIKNNVVKKIKLQKPNSKNVMDYELVNPNVFIGWLPPKGYLPDQLNSPFPCIVVGADGGDDTVEELNYNIKLSFAVYSPGEHIPDEDNNIQFTPSFQGYKDLLNLIDLTKAELIKATIINEKFKIQDKVKWGMYDEQPYPYWYGYITFTIEAEPYPRVNITQYL